MALNVERLLAHAFPDLQQSYDRRDVILYALGLGLGADPLDERDLAYLIETDVKVIPAFAGTLASPGMWMRDPAFGVDFSKLVHAEQDTTFHAPLPAEASVRSTPRIAGLFDRGDGKGAILVVERTISDAETRRDYATIRQTLLLRGNGGFGGEAPPPSAIASGPARPADATITIDISPRAALIYRLSGDWNPLHSDPAAARKAGFARPILHGLATYGMAAHSISQMVGADLTRLACRFSGIVMPGDTLDLRIWSEGETQIQFEAFVADRKVLDRGHAQWMGKTAQSSLVDR